ncbi:MAG: hypothetical protein ABGW81_05080 [Paracoccaceae bacterium]
MKLALDDIGLKQQAEIFDQIATEIGEKPVVVDSDDILANPEIVLREICYNIGFDFQTTMLNWPKGGHKDDGAWASHWYKSVWESEGFAKPAASTSELSDEGSTLSNQALRYYEKLRERRI